MSKEEIVSDIKWALRAGCKRACSPSDIIDDECKCGRDIINILDTYAQGIAVGFAEWASLNDWTCLNGIWYNKRHTISQTSSELLQQFLTNKNEKK